MKDIITENLIIRPSKVSDLEYFYKWELSPAITEFFSIKDNQSMEEVEEEFYKGLSSDSTEQFTICLRESGKAIGRIVMADIIRGWKGEVWRIYIGDPSLRGKGYGYESMLAVMKYSFEDLELERLYLDHYTGNPASELYQSLGFVYEGILRKNCRKNDKLYDVHLMSMLREEYESLYK